jgi:hypothetical protein
MLLPKEASLPIGKIVVIDPDPPDPKNDVLVYQMPIGSRAHGLFVDMLGKLNIEYAVFAYERPERKIKWQDIPPQA